jgi:hypothetical protein
LVTSGWGTSPNNYAKYLAKLDHTDGSIIWEQTYGGQCEGCPLFVGLEIAPGGDLIAVGHTLIPGSSYFGTLLRTTNSGDSLWVRNYQYYDDMVSNGRGLLRDVQPTPDGGFIAVGVALSVAGHYGQDVWVVKTDSMGCIEPGCNLITGMATQLTNLKDALRLWPNPAHAGALVQVEIALPEGFKPDGPLRVTVVSSSGQLVAEEALRGTTGQLPTNNYAPGLYHLHLHDSSRWIAGAKLVVE